MGEEGWIFFYLGERWGEVHFKCAARIIKRSPSGNGSRKIVEMNVFGAIIVMVKLKK